MSKQDHTQAAVSTGVQAAVVESPSQVKSCFEAIWTSPSLRLLFRNVVTFPSIVETDHFALLPRSPSSFLSRVSHPPMACTFPQTAN